MARIQRKSKLWLASAAILSCPVDGFSPMIGPTPPLAWSVVPVTTSATELTGKKKKNKFNKNKKSGGGKGRGGAAAFALAEPPAKANAVVEDETETMEKILTAVIPADPEDGSLPLPEVAMIANDEIFRRKLLAQRFVYEASEVVVVEPLTVEETVIAETTVSNEAFQRNLLARKLEYDAKIAAAATTEAEPEPEPVVEAPKAEIFEPEPEPEPEPVPDNEAFQRKLLAQKLEYDAKAAAAAEPDTEPFQRKLLAQKLEYDAKAAAAAPEPVVEESKLEISEPELVADASEPEPESAVEPEEAFNQTKQPLAADDEANVAAKYAAIADVGERAFAILQDLGFFLRKD